MATIQKRIRKDGTETYRVGYREDGKLLWLPTLAHESGALKIKRIVENPAQGPAVALKILEANAASKKMTLRDYMPRFLDSRRLRCTPGTIKGYEREADRSFLPRLGDLPLDAIDRDAVNEWILWQCQQPTARSEAAQIKAAKDGKPIPPTETVSPKTVRNAHSLLSSVLYQAVVDELIPTNPAHRAHVPDDGVSEEKDIFTRAEWDRFAQAMTPHYLPLILTMLATGARWGEVTALQVRDVDVEAATIHVRRAWKKGEAGAVLGVPKSARSIRSIMVAPWCIAAILPSLDGRAPDDLVFTSPEGKRVHRANFVDRHWTKALRAAGITKHLTPHSLRHTFASWALMAGVPAQTVQHRMGHSSLQTTSRVYAHLLMDEQRRAVDAIGWEPPAAIEA